jgi:hypothetical protein
LIVDNSNFQSNSTGGNGAGMYFDHSTAQFKSNNNFSGNMGNTVLNAIYGRDSIINGTLRATYITTR